MSHWTARARAVSLSLYLLLVNVAGVLIATAAINPPLKQRNLWEWLSAIHWPVTMILVGALATLLLGTPLIAFLCLGWYARYDEFRNSLKSNALDAYLKRFWSKWLLKTIQYAEQQDNSLPAAQDDKQRLNDFQNRWPTLGDRLFANIYHEQYGLWAFVPPFIILLATAYAVVTVATWLCTQGDCASSDKATCIFGLSAPLIVAAIAGAFMFVVSDSVLSIRRRALNASDVYWYALRLFLAMPLALVAANAPSLGAEPHVVLAFALTILPVDEIMKLVRRMAAHNFTDFEKQEDTPDELLNLNGVTKFVTALLHAEGITSIEQMAAADPVTLSIRTGFPFRFTLRLGSQSIVRRHFGPDASTLLPIGLADVVPIYLLMQALDAGSPPGTPPETPPGTPPGSPSGSPPETSPGTPPGTPAATLANVPPLEHAEDIIAEAAARLFPGTQTDEAMARAKAVVKMKFRQIAAEEYTLMLAQITPLDPAL
ncbi:hypothetical protein ACV229_00015 [Burkholderia sp. MR1-5-21]